MNVVVNTANKTMKFEEEMPLDQRKHKHYRHGVVILDATIGPAPEFVNNIRTKHAKISKSILFANTISGVGPEPSTIVIQGDTHISGYEILESEK